MRTWPICAILVRGWFNYYGSYRRSALYAVAWQLDLHLVKWAEWKYKKLKGRTSKAGEWLRRVRKREPGLFVHWMRSPVAAGL